LNIVFKKLKFKNILSYGEEMQEVDFENGLDLLAGKNGNGKSAISDSLFYVLFGKAFRKIKTARLINSTSKGQLLTELDFSVDDKAYRIKRAMRPYRFEIYKTNKDGTEEIIAQQAATKDYQRMLEEEIIKINETVFRQLIILGANIPQSKPFMELNKREKEHLFQLLTDTSVFGKFNEILSIRRNALKNTLKDQEWRLEQIKASLESEQRTISSLEEQNELIEQHKQSSIDQLELKKLRTEAGIVKLKEGLSKLIAIKEDYDSAEQSRIALQNDLSINKAALVNLKSDLHKIQIKETNVIKCLKCNEINYVKDNGADVSKKEHIIKDIEDLNALISNKNIDLNNFIEESRLLKDKLLSGKRVKDNLTQFNNDLLHYSSEIENLKNSRPIVIRYDLLEEKKLEYVELSNNVKINSSKMMDYEEIKAVVDDGGLKSVVIKQQVPLLNKKINEFLELFSLQEYSFVVDENFNEKIISKDASDGEFNELSNGQKARISFSIMFAFLKLIEERNGVNINVMILDEVLDSSVDSNGREELLDILSNQFRDKKNVIIISHNDEIKEKLEVFNRVFNIHKEDYSSIECTIL